MPNGNLSEYSREHPDFDKLGLVCTTADMVVDSSNGRDPLSTNYWVSPGDWPTYIGTAWITGT